MTAPAAIPNYPGDGKGDGIFDDDTVAMLAEMKADAEEPLCAELAEHVEDRDGWPALRHPLVYQIPLYSPGSANRQLARKKAAIADARGAGRPAAVVWMHERPYRLDALLDLRDDTAVEMDEATYWPLLRDVWVDSENVWQNLDRWAGAFAAADGRCRALTMTDTERAALAALPDPVPVYRGAHREVNEDGLSWTTDRERAAWFARRFAGADREPVVIHATVPKARVVGYFLGRGESEVVVEDLDAADVTLYEEDP